MLHNLYIAFVVLQCVNVGSRQSREKAGWEFEKLLVVKARLEETGPV